MIWVRAAETPLRNWVLLLASASDRTVILAFKCLEDISEQTCFALVCLATPTVQTMILRGLLATIVSMHSTNSSSNSPTDGTMTVTSLGNMVGLTGCCVGVVRR